MLSRVVLLMVGAVLILGIPSPHALAASAAEQSKTGLETGNRTVWYLIEELSRQATRTGLSEERVRATVEARIRHAGLMPELVVPEIGYLNVHISVVGPVFSIKLSFLRPVEFSDTGGRLFSATAATWNRSALGTHGGDGEQILRSLDEKLDEFLNDYLKANPRRRAPAGTPLRTPGR